MEISLRLSYTPPITRTPKILALDIGTKSCGLAATDALGLTVQPLDTIFFKGQAEIHKVYAALKDIIIDRTPTIILAGLPLNTDGSSGTQAQKVKNFINGLKNFLKQNAVDTNSIRWEFFDERYTSEEAKDFFIENNVPKSKRNGLIDSFAAVFILKRFLEEQSH